MTVSAWNWSSIRTYIHVALVWFGLGLLAHDRVWQWAGIGQSDTKVVAALGEISGKLDRIQAAIESIRPIPPTPIPPTPVPPTPVPPKPNPNPPWIPPGPKPDPPAPTPLDQPNGVMPVAPQTDANGSTIYEWRILPWAPNWKAHGRWVDGEFLFRDWIPMNGKAR